MCEGKLYKYILKEDLSINFLPYLLLEKKIVNYSAFGAVGGLVANFDYNKSDFLDEINFWESKKITKIDYLISMF
jgi:hypothetical protein